MKNAPTNYNDIIDSRDVIERIEELESECVNWVAGWNIPGYLPDEPLQWLTEWSDARDYLTETLEQWIENCESAEYADDALQAEQQTQIDEWQAAIETLDNAEDGAEFGQFAGEYFFQIEKGDGLPEDPDDAAELKALRDLVDEASDSPDWEYGEALIRDTYFKAYAQQLAEDCYDMPEGWPFRCIDWDQAARELQMDYFSVEFDGVDYWIRS